MGTYIGHLGDVCIPKKKAELADRVLKILYQGGMLGADWVDLYGSRLRLLSPVYEEGGVRVLMRRIEANKIRCKKCGDVIESTHRHDFKYCQCGAVAVDGGRDYLRRCGELEDWEELSRWSEE